MRNYTIPEQLNDCQCVTVLNYKTINMIMFRTISTIMFRTKLILIYTQNAKYVDKWKLNYANYEGL